MAAAIRVQIAGVDSLDKRRLGGVEEIERARARFRRELPQEAGEDGGREMLDHFDAHAGVERPFEIGNRADMVVGALSALAWGRREQFDAMHSLGQAGNQLTERVEQVSGAAADVQGAPHWRARHAKRLRHPRHARAERPFARRGKLPLPIGIAIVAGGAGVDGRQEIRVRE